jgi:cytochrome P450
LRATTAPPSIPEAPVPAPVVPVLGPGGDAPVPAPLPVAPPAPSLAIVSPHASASDVHAATKPIRKKEERRMDDRLHEHRCPMVGDDLVNPQQGRYRRTPMSDATSKLPGGTGLPVLGETLRFLAGPYTFVNDGVEKHGNVFRTHLFGRPCAVVTGPGAAALFVDHAKVQREGSQPANVFALFAGPSLPHLDGDAHRERKAIMMQAFTRSALAAYLPGMQAHVEAAFERWAGLRSPIRWMDELQRLAMESVCGSILGMTAGPRVGELIGHYRTIDLAFTGIPVKLPGTAYRKGLDAVEAILTIFCGAIDEHRKKPTEDGLSRILAHVTHAGRRITDDEAARELHHLVIAGRIVWSHLATLVLELPRNPALKAKLEEEIRAGSPSGAITSEQLQGLGYLRRVVLEVKRMSPVVPGVFGLAKEDIEFEGHTIPKGWMLLLGLRRSHEMGAVYEHPKRFDPERFAEGRAEHEKHAHAFFPHGPGAFATSHHCAGTDYATYLTEVFAIVLARRYAYKLAPQDLGYRFSQLTPEPKDGLLATITRAE